MDKPTTLIKLSNYKNYITSQKSTQWGMHGGFLRGFRRGNLLLAIIISWKWSVWGLKNPLMYKKNVGPTCQWMCAYLTWRGGNKVRSSRLWCGFFGHLWNGMRGEVTFSPNLSPSSVWPFDDGELRWHPWAWIQQRHYGFMIQILSIPWHGSYLLRTCSWPMRSQPSDQRSTV